MRDDYVNDRLVPALEVMAEPVRIRILQIIAARGEVCARDLLPEFAITQPTLSHHMRLLVENDLVIVRREGRCSYYSICHQTISAISELLTAFNEPPLVLTTPESKRATAKKTQERRKAAQAPALKKTSSVPIPMKPVEGPDIGKLKKNKKKSKDKDKKKDKKKKK